jgi:hypothetical protein
MMVSSLRSSQLEVLVDRCEWHRVVVSLEETALVLSPLGDGFVDLGPSAAAELPLASGAWNAEKRFVRILKQEGQGLGISIQGGAEGGRPIVIRWIIP